MGAILFLSHRIPFPPDRGDKIRSHHVLKALAKLAPVHVGCLAESDEDRAEERELAAVAASYCLADRPASLPIAGLTALLSGKPISEASFASRELKRWVDRTLVQRDISAIYVFSNQMGAYLPDSFSGRLVVDLVDFDSAKFVAYADKGGPMAWVYRREARLIREREIRLARRADHTLLVTREEVAAFEVGLPDSEGYAIEVLENGIDAAAFAPGNGVGKTYDSDARPRLIFTGQMDYPPNVSAAVRLARNILPKVLAKYAGARVEIVGRSPTDSVRALGNGHIAIHGAVPQVQDYLAAADIAVIPLDIARGVQNKVLEAMAMGLPCVVSEGAATGIPAQDGRDFVIARSDEDFAAAIDAIAANPERAKAMGEAARRWVIANASWEAALEELPALIGMEAAP